MTAHDGIVAESGPIMFSLAPQIRDFTKLFHIAGKLSEDLETRLLHTSLEPLTNMFFSSSHHHHHWSEVNIFLILSIYILILIVLDAMHQDKWIVK